jgi:hypothetical protein
MIHSTIKFELNKIPEFSTTQGTVFASIRFQKSHYVGVNNHGTKLCSLVYRRS